MTQQHRIESDKRAIVRALLTIVVVIIFASGGWCQEKRTKIRISNAGFTITALPLLAAKDWGVFNANGLDVELIVMSPTLAAAAVAQGDIDYVAGVRGRDTERLALTSDLVFVGQNFLLAAERAGLQNAAKS